MVNIIDENDLELLAKIEGETWHQSQLREPNDACKFTELHAAFLALTAAKNAGDTTAKLIKYVTLTTVIYGRSGGNRYFLDESGEIKLSRHHASQENLAQANSLGFRNK